MGRGKTVVLTTREFVNQGLATSFFKDMLGRYRPGDRVADLDSLDLAALLERHDEYETKVGAGVSHFEVMMTEHGTPCFKIVRADGSSTDFSYRHCITQRPPTHKQEVDFAFRRAVRFDLYKARDDFFASNKDADGLIRCAETGELIGRDNSHMDHRAPMTFEVIVTTFLASRGMAVDNVPLTTGRDNQVSPELTDPVLSEAFRKYHADVAALDLVKDKANLSQSARNRLKPTRIKLA